jgi:hypothetical protein
MLPGGHTADARLEGNDGARAYQVRGRIGHGHQTALCAPFALPGTALCACGFGATLFISSLQSSAEPLGSMRPHQSAERKVTLRMVVAGLLDERLDDGSELLAVTRRCTGHSCGCGCSWGQDLQQLLPLPLQYQ